MKTAEIQEIIAQPSQIGALAHGTDSVRLTENGALVAVLTPVKAPPTLFGKADRPSLKNPPPPISLGKIIKPWTTRAELLEDFFDRSE